MSDRVKITRKAYEQIDPDYRGIWHDYWGDHPEWVGRRTVISTCITYDVNACAELWIEGVHFDITEE